MSDAIQVRRLTAANAELAQAAIRCIKQRDLPSEQLESQIANMPEWLADVGNILLVASNGNVPVGFALGYLLGRIDNLRRMLFFYEIEVVPRVRQRGTGSALVEAMKTIAREQQVVKMWVQTDPDNVAARALYHSMGGIEKAQPDLVISWINGDNL